MIKEFSTIEIDSKIRLPNLVIIGAMKCGTVSLHQYLALHPEISMSPLKEVDYFVEELNWRNGLKWYSLHFPDNARVMGERSTSYTKYPTYQGIPERMYSLIPGAKLIYNVRDPLKRVISNYQHEVTRRRENRSFEAALKDLSTSPYVHYSKYYYQIQQYLKFFSEEQILIISLEELSKNKLGSLRRIFQFLEVDPSFNHPDFDRVHHRSSEMKRPTWLKRQFYGKRGYAYLYGKAPWLFEQAVNRPDLSKSLRERLAEALQTDVEQLRAFTGQKFEEWNL